MKTREEILLELGAKENPRRPVSHYLDVRLLRKAKEQIGKESVSRLIEELLKDFCESTK